MRQIIVAVILAVLHLAANAQSVAGDDETLAKLRGLYDAPFTHNLVSFTCDVQFDWNKHFVQTVGAVPPAALPTLSRLQAAHHRVFVDRSGATMSQGPSPDDLSKLPHATDLESALEAMITSGLNAWIPFASNVILPERPTTFTMQHLNTGVKMVMSGPGVSATLMLQPDMRITRVLSDRPQPLHFSTEFSNGPNGFLLQSVRTGSGAIDDGTWNADFAYKYQSIGGFQIPASASVTQETTKEKWDYVLTECKAVSGVTLNVLPPKN